jgi:hypothetical protein
VQKLPKGALVIVKGGDMLGNAALLEENDVEITFQPPEAVSAVRIPATYNLCSSFSGDVMVFAGFVHACMYACMAFQCEISGLRHYNTVSLHHSCGFYEHSSSLY